MSRRINPADENNDGSQGRWVGGLPAEVAGRSASSITFDHQAGCPVQYSGGTHKPTQTSSMTEAAGKPRKPFKLNP